MQETGNNIDSTFVSTAGNYTLSIRIDSDGFCFFISGPTEKQSKQLIRVYGKENHILSFKNTFEKALSLQGFKEANVVIRTSDYSFIPSLFKDLEYSPTLLSNAGSED